MCLLLGGNNDTTSLHHGVEGRINSAAKGLVRPVSEHGSRHHHGIDRLVVGHLDLPGQTRTARRRGVALVDRSAASLVSTFERSTAGDRAVDSSPKRRTRVWNMAARIASNATPPLSRDLEPRLHAFAADIRGGESDRGTSYAWTIDRSTDEDRSRDSIRPRMR